MRTSHQGLFSLLTISALTLPVIAQRSLDVRISTSPAGGQSLAHPRIATVGDSVHVVWQNSSTGEIHYTHSTDRGATWQTTDTQLDVGMTAGLSLSPDLAAAGSTVYVVWEEHRGTSANGDIWCNRSLDGGATWLPSAVRLDVGSPVSGSDSRSPKVACSGTNVQVVWEDLRNGSIDIYANRSLDSGTTWLGNDVRLDGGDAPGSHVSTLPQIASAGANVFVTWADERAGSLDYDIYFNRSTDGGTTWLPAALRIDHAPVARVAYKPTIACSGSNVYLVWQDDRDNGTRNIYSNRSTDAGATWLPTDRRLDSDVPNTGPSEDPLVCCDGNLVYVIWIDNRSFVNPQVWFNRSTDAGATWLPSDVCLATSTSPCPAFDPRIACSGSLVCVVWENLSCGGSGQGDLHCTRSTDQGATWLPFDVHLEIDAVGAHASTEPRIAMSGTQPHVVWMETRNGTRPDIYWSVPFGALPYGTATPGTGNVAPKLALTGPATLGSAVSLDLGTCLANAPGVLFLGGPGSKIALPVLGGLILVQPLVSVPITASPAGTLSIPLTIPSSAATVGVNLNFQELFFDAGAAGGVSMSNGVELWIG